MQTVNNRSLVKEVPGIVPAPPLLWISLALLGFRVVLIALAVIAADKLSSKFRLSVSCLRGVLIMAAFVKLFRQKKNPFPIG